MTVLFFTFKISYYARDVQAWTALTDAKRCLRQPCPSAVCDRVKTA